VGGGQEKVCRKKKDAESGIMIERGAKRRGGVCKLLKGEKGRNSTLSKGTQKDR